MAVAAAAAYDLKQGTHEHSFVRRFLRVWTNSALARTEMRRQYRFAGWISDWSVRVAMQPAADRCLAWLQGYRQKDSIG